MSNSRTRVLFTGAPGALAGLAARVEAEGAQFTTWPLLSFAPPADPSPLVQALHRLDQFAALCITSPRAAEAVARIAARDAIDLALAPVVWSSAACAAVLAPHFPRIAIPPVERAPAGLGVALASAMLDHDVGSPVLFASGDLHREELVNHLRRAGRVVQVVEAYRTVVAAPSRAAAVMAAADILVVTSPSVARLLASVGHRERPALVAIGPTTADEARRQGWPPDAVAASPAVAAVAAAIHSLLPSYS